MRSVVGLIVVGLCAALAGCGADLGTCDKDASEEVVYLNGTPYFEGQGLVEQSCAGSQCHAAGAVGVARSGAPHGLNFDVEVLTASSDEARLGVLREGISRIRDEAAELWGVIDSGEMPPGKAGERPALSWKRDLDGKVDAELASIDTAAGRDIVRNWLACGSPLVSATRDSPMADQAKLIGAVMDAGESTTTATWDAVYTDVLTACASCHKPAPSTFPQLDLSSQAVAFAALVDKTGSAGSACSGQKLVIPGNCEESLLYKKLQPAGEAKNLCGSPMPLGGSSIPDAQLQAVCDWIDAGAKK